MKKIYLLFLTAVIFAGVYLVSCQHEPLPGPNGQSPDPIPPDTSISLICDPDTVYFVNDILPMFQSSCAKSGCHDAATQADGVYLGTYASIMSTGDVEPFKPNNSEVYEVLIETDPRKRMPPPPEQALSASQIALIGKWITQGAKNNYCASQDCDSVTVTFSATIWPVIQTSCKGCHSGGNPGGGIRLENYTDVKNYASPMIWASINYLPGYSAMPKNGAKLSGCKIGQFKRWMDLGMPNN